MSTAKRYQPECRNAWARARDARLKASGAEYATTVRLTPKAHQLLRELCDRHDCSVRDVVEGLLLGTITTMPGKPGRQPNPYGLSPDEITTALSLGIALPKHRHSR